MPQNRSGKDALGIIASKRGHESLERLFAHHARTLERYFLYVTWGTYYKSILNADDRRRLAPLMEAGDVLAAYGARKLDWAPREPWMKDGHALRPGKRGGMIEMAEHLEESASKDRIGTLIFLSHPDDLEESYPEDRALFRSILRNNVVYLPTERTARYWASFESDARTEPSVDTLDPQKEVLALIAHDGKKLEMCRWVVEHRQRLRCFGGFLATGTTGAWVASFLKAAGVEAGKIALFDPQESGPKGGDIQIAGAILRGECRHVVFFVDPMTPHPHEADIQALIRVCCMPDVDVNLRLNEAAATSWINTVPVS